MKNLILTLTLAASIAAPLSLNAQEPKPERPKQGREGGPGEGRPGGPGGGGGQRVSPEERLKRLTEALTLTQEQQDKVKKIFEEGREEFGKLRDVPEDQRREKGRELFEKQNEKIMGVLTPEQQGKYKEIQERMRQGGRPGGPGGPGGPRGEGGKGDGGKRPDGGAKPEEKK